MALTVGTDTYISITDADTYISENYLAADATYTTWDSFSDADKEILLRRACRKIDQQLYKGKKADYEQSLKFPLSVYSHYSGEFCTQEETPDAVTYAQVEEAIALAAGTPDRIQLQKEGVSSFSLGSLSESYNSNSSLKTENRLISLEAIQLLKPYLLKRAYII